jgi:hypothetical protein
LDNINDIEERQEMEKNQKHKLLECFVKFLYVLEEEPQKNLA